VICYNPFRPFHNRVVRRFVPERAVTRSRGGAGEPGDAHRAQPGAAHALHSRLRSASSSTDDPSFQGDIILLEPGETDLAFFKMAPLNLWPAARVRMAYLS